MYSVEKTKAELIRRFQANGWKPITVTIKDTGDTVTIEPCYYKTETPSTDTDCEWFLMDCEGFNFTGDEKLESIANQLVHFAKIKQDIIKSRASLQKFYEHNLAHHTATEWELARKISKMFYDAWCKTHDDSDIFKKTQFPIIAKTLNISVKDVENGYNLMDNASYYSDAYKPLYGYRPKNLF